MRKLIIVGARDHARQIHDAVLAVNNVHPSWDFQGFLGDGRSDPETIAARNASILGNLNDIDALDVDPRETAYIIGSGSPKDRQRIDHFLSEKGFPAASIIHPSAVVGTLTTIGPGCYIGALAVLQTAVTLGRHVHVNVHASVSHDAVLEDYAMLNPGARVLGRVKVGEGSVIGANAAVRERLTVGSWSTVGMSAAVVKNVGDNVTVAGVPAAELATTPPTPTQPLAIER
jgi:sugar O-acyltransferase (sialic acid O-acetyltransferase NeuD family)